MQVISAAIRDRHLLTFTYDGERRMVEPHCYGRDSKGHDALRAWQVHKGWRLFHVADMRGLQDTGETFSGTRPGYKSADKHMATIYAAL